jgi:hypothetical protein
MKRIYIALGFCLLLSTQLFGAEIIDRMVAVVDGRIFTSSDVRKERLVAGAFGEQAKDDDATLQDLVDRALVEEQIAQFAEIQVTNEEVDAALQTIKASAGVRAEDLHYAVQQRILRARYFEFRFGQFIRATDEEIQRYYDDVFVPEAKTRGLTAIPSLEQATEMIRANIVDEKMSQEVQSWLETVRTRSNVEIFK